MSKLKSLEDLRKLKDDTSKMMTVREATGTKITVGMGTCGIGSGARETMQAILEELARRDIVAHVSTVGCVGLCIEEPLVDIEQGKKPRITYGKLTADKVSRMIQEHLVEGKIISEWVVSKGTAS
jgi:NADP-reducing hydrogenase subunit HndB